MFTQKNILLQVLDPAFAVLTGNLKGLTLQEALFVPPGGYRSIIGTLKHTAAWSHVYRSYAFDASPISWSHLEWPDTLAYPYAVEADATLLNRVAAGMRKGITISSPGFYGPQGRRLRLEPFDNEINDNIATFRFKGDTITNYEMESSAIYGLSKLLNHRALTVCVVIANRVTGEFLTDYKPAMKILAQHVLDALSS